MRESGGKIKTTCCYCGVGCGIEIWKDDRGMLHVDGDKSHPVNKGMLCSKGRNLNYVAQDISDRILYPAVRNTKSGKLIRNSWDEALDYVSSKFKSIIRKHGPDAVAFYVSGQCLTEEYYVANKLVKAGIGTNNIDTNSRLCMSSAVVGYKQVFGEDSIPSSYEDIELSDCIYIAGANPAYCHPVLFRRIEEHKEKKPNVKIIVADPRRTQSCELADIHLQLRPGSDVVLNHAISRILIEQNWVDWEFIENHTDGFEKFKEKIFERSAAEAAEICDVSEDLIFQTARIIGKSNGFISLWAMGLNQSLVGVEKNVSLLNISLLTGMVGKPGSGPFSLTGQPNAMGGREVGGMSNLLPAHRDLANKKHREEVAGFWEVDSIPEKPGYTATEMFDAIGTGKVKAIWIICTNPMVSLPDLKKMEANLSRADLVVVQDISYKSDTVAFADVLLPAAGWLEKEGTMTNSERRISYLPKYLEAPGEALPDMEILCRFAQKMGFKGFDFKSAEEVFNEHAALTYGTNMDIAALNYCTLKNKGTIQWPYKIGQEKGTVRLFSDNKFFTPTGKAQFRVDLTETTIVKPGPDELILTTGRIRDQWHTMTKTGKVVRLNQHEDKPYAELNSEDARQRSIHDGDIIRLYSKQNEIKVKARVSSSIRKGVVFVPMHWSKQLNDGRARANNLTENRTDPLSKEPDFKYSIVKCEKILPSTGRVIVVGGGAASYKFVTEFRKKNKKDEVVVFSKEPHVFYDRVQLPEYINGKRSWEKLSKTELKEIYELNIDVHTNCSIVSIDANNKKVIDIYGETHRYEKLVLATGSAPNLPEKFTNISDRVFTLRTRYDADLIKKSVAPGEKVVVYGGSLLGLEIAGALNELGTEVVLIYRGSALMQRQLDTIASKILLRQVTKAGIDVKLNTTIDAVSQEESLQIGLNSGESMECNAMVFAIGTRPLVDLAKDAKLRVNRAIVVDQHLRTSNKNIFALGEVAEYEGKSWGITAAAEEQAEILADYLNGDVLARYTGSLEMNILKFPGIELCSIGRIPAESEEYEEVILSDQSRNYYKRCFIQNDRLVGAILVGDKSEMAGFKNWISTGLELAENREKILCSGTVSKPVKGRLVCSCLNVGSGNIQEAIEGGCLTVTDIGKETGAGTGCGSCKPELKSLLPVSSEKKPVVLK